jgi:hypothetical protein
MDGGSVPAEGDNTRIVLASAGMCGAEEIVPTQVDLALARTSGAGH